MMPATSSGALAAVPVTPVSAADKRMQVDALLTEILKRMGYPARLEFKDMADGGLGVAVHFGGAELPGISGNKRTYLVDCIQFLVNKVVNRPNVEKRWVTLGVNGFPEPRGPKLEPSAPTTPRASAPLKAAPAVAARASAPPANQGQPPQQGKRGHHDAKPPAPGAQPQHARSGRPDHDEKSMKVEPSALMTRAGTTLAEKAAKFGRFYAMTLLATEDRARVLAAAAPVKGASVKAEGEGYFRRVTFTPEKPTVITKKQVMPDYDDDE